MAPHPVLVAYDGRCDATLRAGAVLAAALRVEVVVATAYRYEPIALSSRVLPDPASDVRRERADRVAGRAAAVLGLPPADVRVLPAGDVVEALAEEAVAVGATTVVLGPDMLRDVARRLVAHAPCPVLVTPEDPRLVPEGIATVGVAYDDSGGSRLALVAAADLAIRAGARLRIVAVAAFPGDRAAVLAGARAAAAALDRVETEVDVRVGEITWQLRAAAREVDVLVCGSHGRGRMRRALLGSVSTGLIDLPSCPVMVVPHGARREGGTALGLATAGAR